MKQPEFVTPESLLLDTAERLSRVRAGRIALVVHLSRLTRAYADPAYGRIAARLFDGLVANYRCQLFILTNGDIVATGKDMPFGEVDGVIAKLRTLFDADPLVHEDAYGPADRFCSWYDLENDFEPFLAMAETALKTISAAAPRRGRTPDKPRAPTPQDMERILAGLSDKAVLPFITGQAAVNVSAGGEATFAFQEFYVSVADLAQRLAPGVDLAADRWLFQHFSTFLDRRLLAGIQNLSLYGRELDVNLNLNAATVRSPAFADFLKRFPQARICVEFQPIDAFANLETFIDACALLHETGHRAAIDGLTPLSLWMLADADLPVDAFKLMWSPDIAAGHHGAADRDPHVLIRALGPERTILGRCDGIEAIQWGLRQGIRTFQGRFVDATLVDRANRGAAPTEAQS